MCWDSRTRELQVSYLAHNVFTNIYIKRKTAIEMSTNNEILLCMSSFFWNYPFENLLHITNTKFNQIKSESEYILIRSACKICDQSSCRVTIICRNLVIISEDLCHFNVLLYYCCSFVHCVQLKENYAKIFIAYAKIDYASTVLCRHREERAFRA